jgi:hypothetical protein
MDLQSNPFAVLSLIVAPAILTNASSVLAMSTSNRLGRVADRSRELARELDAETDLATPRAQRRLRELNAIGRRFLMLLKALSSFYVALGSFAAATLFSLLGAVLVPLGAGGALPALALVSFAAGLVALLALARGSAVLIAETRIAVQLLEERTAALKARAEAGQASGAPPR